VKEDWSSYNSIAETYARVAEGLYFTRPASDLLSLLHLAPGSRVLDVGTGTGVVAAFAAGLVGPTGLVVGIDPAIEMLRRRRDRSRVKVVVGELPQLPHPDASFDAVAAAFVLTHVPDYASALHAMVRVLRPGGRLAISAWSRSPSSTPPGEMWQAAVREFVSEEDLRAALRTALPWEEAFSNPVFLETALAAVGVTQISVHEARYAIEMATKSFIESHLLSLSSRYMEVSLGPREWSRFTEKVSHRLVDVFGAHVQFEVTMNIGVGTRPANPALHPTAAALTMSGCG
jgi:ubiquinone/menaquinone biosynthesis C-methylase UbiE